LLATTFSVCTVFYNHDNNSNSKKFNEVHHFRVADPTYGFSRDQLVKSAGKMQIVIDITVSNAITPDIKEKIGKPSAGEKAQSKWVSKSAKYQDL